MTDSTRLSSCSYNSVSTTCFKFLTCLHLNSGHVLMASVPSVSCESGEYRAVLPVVVLLLLVFVLGIPIGLLALFVWSYRTMGECLSTGRLAHSLMIDD